MKITLLGHSGFLVEGETACLVFDYLTDELALADRLPFGEKPVVFFASHSHRDHYVKKILDYARHEQVGYVLGAGIPQPAGANAVVLAKGEAAVMLGIAVQAYGSTDEGVSFLVEFEGKRLFHAGDLNDWYWEDESTAEELLHDEQWFLNEIAPLAGSRPDVAFFPTDGRLGSHALRGALRFARDAQPAILISMHLGGGDGLPAELSKRLREEGLPTLAAQIAQPGDSIAL